MHQPSWSYASSITKPSWRWSYEHGKSYTRWLHRTPIKTRKYYHVSTFTIIRIKHNSITLALELSTWTELRKMVTSHTDQYTKRLWCINLHDYTHQAKPNHLGVGVINMERATQDGYITHRSKHEKIIMHQPSWSYASSITQTLALELSTWKELRKMVTSHTDQYTKRSSCINLHDHTHQA